MCLTYLHISMYADMWGLKGYTEYWGYTVILYIYLTMNISNLIREHWDSICKVLVFTQGQAALPLCLRRNGLLDSLSSLPMLRRIALTTRLRSRLGHVQPQEAAAMPTAICSAPQTFKKSPKHLWETMHCETVALEPLSTSLLGSGFICLPLNECWMTRSSCTQRWPERSEPARELLHGFLNFPEEDGILQELNLLTLVFVCWHVRRSVVSAEARQPREDWWMRVREHEEEVAPINAWDAMRRSWFVCLRQHQINIENIVVQNAGRCNEEANKPNWSSTVALNSIWWLVKEMRL